MNTRYCTCGKANLYELTKPRFCGGCGKDMEAVFASAGSAPIAAPAPVAQPRAPKSIHPASRHRLQSNRKGPDEDEDPIEMHNDGELTHVSAYELAAKIGSPFVPSLDQDDGNGSCVRLGSLQNIQDTIAKIQQEQAPVKKVRRRKGLN